MNKFIQSQSVVRTMKWALLVISALFMGEYVGLYISSQSFLRGLTLLNRTNRTFDITRQLGQAVDSIQEVTKLRKSGGNIQDAAVAFGSIDEQVHKLLAEGLSLASSDPQIYQSLLDLKESLAQLRKHSERIIESQQNRQNQEVREQEELFANQFQLESNEILKRAQISLRSNSERIFSKVYGERLFPFISGIGITLGFMLFALVVGLGIVRRFREALQNLLTATASVAQGSLSFRAPILAPDEFGQLTDSFNQMTERLQDSMVSRSFFENLVESILDSLVVFSPENTIVRVNQMTTSMFGYSREELAGQPAELIFSNGLILATSRRNVETICRSKEGKEIPVAVSISLLYESSGKFVGKLCIIEDIAERKKVEQAMTDAREAAEQSNRAKSGFLAAMSHEIRTPMNGVIGMSGLLLHTDLSDVQKDYCETIRNSAETLMTVINDILDFSKIEAGRMELESVSFSPRTVVEEMADLMASSVQAKGLELVCNVERNVPDQVQGDAGRLRQVLVNLVGNATKFTEVGEILVSVKLLQEDEKGIRLTFEVRDTGIGIAPQVQSGLFQPFSQADVSTTRKYGGTGLGLAISRQLVEAMGGEIRLESELGVGSTFSFSILLRADSLGGSQVKEIPGGLVNRRALIVDDNRTNRIVLSGQLAYWGIQVVAAGSAKEALNILSTEEYGRFDFGILDMHMPEMDGLELSRHIHNLPDNKDLPLILLTSLVHADFNKGEGSEFKEFLTKPVRQSRLHDSIVVLFSDEPYDAPFSNRIVENQIKIQSNPNPAVLAARKQMKILVAEDNRTNQMVVVRMLERLNFRADVVANGLEAVEAVGRIPYDLVLMDCQMPEMDGFNATAQIRKKEALDKHTVILALTADAMRGDRERCFRVGMDGYLSKPISEIQLEILLDSWIKKLGFLDDLPQSAIEEKRLVSKGISITFDQTRALAQYGNNPSFFSEMITDLLKDDLPSLMKKVEIAIQAKDHAALKEALHSLKGCVNNFFPTFVPVTISHLENIKGFEDFEQINKEYRTLEEQMASLKKDLSQFIL